MRIKIISLALLSCVAVATMFGMNQSNDAALSAWRGTMQDGRPCKLNLAEPKKHYFVADLDCAGYQCIKHMSYSKQTYQNMKRWSIGVGIASMLLTGIFGWSYHSRYNCRFGFFPYVSLCGMGALFTSISAYFACAVYHVVKFNDENYEKICAEKHKIFGCHIPMSAPKNQKPITATRPRSLSDGNIRHSNDDPSYGHDIEHDAIYTAFFGQMSDQNCNNNNNNNNRS